MQDAIYSFKALHDISKLIKTAKNNGNTALAKALNEAWYIANNMHCDAMMKLNNKEWDSVFLIISSIK